MGSVKQGGIKMGKRKIFSDILLNITATMIPTVTLQLLIFPMLSNYMSSEAYGLVVTMLAVFNVIPARMGTALNNVRLIHEEKYKKMDKGGDFQILLIMAEVINTVTIYFVSIYYLGKFDFFSVFLTVIVSILWLAREYHIVTFRIELNYTGIVVNNLYMVTGYFLGYIFFKETGYWQWIYLWGMVLSYYPVFRNSKIIYERFDITTLFPAVAKDTMFLIIAMTLARAINYADKILLYPLLGGTMVSIYYVATLFGKIISLVITPLNSVALSYLSKINNKPDSIFKWTYIVGSILCILGYLLSITLSRPVLSILYPTYVDEAMKYIYITSGTSVISVLTSLINSFVLCFFDSKWQICINAVTTIIYVVLTLSLLKLGGLAGFSIGALLANISKLIITTLVYIRVSTRAYVV